jgi:lipopolysaccharide/colanic/teichoic acid biosynthesis glycosyltransferase
MTRFFDVLFSFIAIVILFPFMLPVMLALKLTGEHYIFYGQPRIGKNGQEFKLLKFATMLKNSPNLPGGLYTSKNDPRMLPFGLFLRKTKINELPQLVNIFIGQMSIIGYRPTVKQHFEGYPDAAKQKLISVRPGLSGIGSIAFRNEEEILQLQDDKKAFHQKIIAPYKSALECWYIDHRSLNIYFKLIFMTMEAVIHPDSKKWHTSFCDLPPIPNELSELI